MSSHHAVDSPASFWRLCGKLQYLYGIYDVDEIVLRTQSPWFNSDEVSAKKRHNFSAKVLELCFFSTNSLKWNCFKVYNSYTNWVSEILKRGIFQVLIRPLIVMDAIILIYSVCDHLDVLVQNQRNSGALTSKLCCFYANSLTWVAMCLFWMM